MCDTPKSSSRGIRPLLVALGLLMVLGPACAIARDPRPLSQEDVDWLRRDGFELDSATVAKFRDLGRSRLLDQQLDDRNGDQLPPAISALINSYEVANTPTEQLLVNLRD